MHLTPGTRLGTYEIVSPLGAGGMGEVYRAKDLRLGREVALKVLPAGVAADTGRLARFEREARAVAALNHPNIVVLYAVEDEGAIRFLTMELVEGKSLDQHVTPGGLPLTRVIEIGIALGDMAPHLNSQLAESLAPEQFVTLFIGELDHETGELTYFNAGHEPPRLLREGTDEIALLDSTGRPVGLLPFGEFEVEKVTLEPGDVLSIFSDGIPEATRDGNDFLGDGAVDEAMRAYRTAPLKQMREDVLNKVQGFLTPNEASDDVTLMLLRRQAG